MDPGYEKGQTEFIHHITNYWETEKQPFQKLAWNSQLGHGTLPLV